MFSGVSEAPEWIEQNYINTCKSHLHCPEWVRRMPLTNHVAANVDYKVAYAYLLKVAIKGIKTCHPRDMLEEQLKAGPIEVSTGGARVLPRTIAPDAVVFESIATTTTTATTTVTSTSSVAQGPQTCVIDLPLHMGYFLPVDRKDDAIPAWISDAVAFQHTSSDAKAKAGVTGITVTERAQEKLRLAEQFFVADVPKEFCGNALLNASALYKMYKLPKLDGKRNHTLGLAHSQMARNWKSRALRPVTNPPNELKKYVVDKDGSSYLPFPTLLQQNDLVNSTNKFYMVLRDHREIRGSDNKHVSALTSGYYLGAMSRSLDKILWQSVDILTVARALKAPNVYFDKADLNTNVAAVLVANGLKLFVGSGKQIVSKLFTTIDLTRTRFPEACLMYVPSYFTTTAPSVTKKGIIGQTKSEFDSMFSEFCSGDIYRMTHLYLLEYHADNLKYLFPSIHCHAGHVICVNRQINAKPMSIVQHFGRMSLANKYKTAFPVRRVSFCLADTYCPKILKTGIKLTSSVVAHADSDLDYSTYETKEIIDIGHVDVQPLVFASTQVQEVQCADLAIDQQFVFLPQDRVLAVDDIDDNGHVDDVVDGSDGDDEEEVGYGTMAG